MAKKSSKSARSRKSSSRTKSRRSSVRTASKRKTRKPTTRRSRAVPAIRKALGRRITRKQFLKTAGVGAAALGVAAVGLSKVAKAQAPPIPTTEVIYLADSGPFNDGKTKLFTVDIESTPGQAILTPLPQFLGGYGPGEIPLDQADSLGCTPDGKRLYLIDKKGGFMGEAHAKIGYVDLTTNSWVYLGYVTSNAVEVPGVGQAAFSPDGLLYFASDTTDRLYVLDPESATPTNATDLGLITNRANSQKVNVSGADLVFGADGTLYLWANSANPRGLYTLDLSTPGTVYADHLGGQPGPYFTGLAIRENGVGDLIGSVSGYPFPTPPKPLGSNIIEIDKTNGDVTAQYRMYLNGQPHDYWFGDMTAGPLVLCTRTIGYWKNHSWDGTVTICGEVVDEDLGRDKLLKNARGNNFSMFLAQLIAAKLNTFDAPNVPLIAEAEEWLCMQYDKMGLDIIENYNAPFASKKQKRDAVAYWEALDEFNNSFPCD